MLYVTDSVFVMWINNFKYSLKMSASLALANEHLKL